MDQFLSLIVQYGLPSVALAFVVWASATGKIVWKPTLDAELEHRKTIQAQADQERVEKEMYRDSLLDSKHTLERGVRIAEKAERVSRVRS